MPQPPRQLLQVYFLCEKKGLHKTFFIMKQIQKRPLRRKFEHELSSVVLYTIAENDNNTRKELEDFLKSLHFMKEGDQSTMILSAKHSALNPYELKIKLDKLCKTTQFSYDDCITLIRPAHQTYKLGKNDTFYRNILQRYKYEFDKESNSFSITPDRRKSILNIQAIKR